MPRTFSTIRIRGLLKRTASNAVKSTLEETPVDDGPNGTSREFSVDKSTQGLPRIQSLVPSGETWRWLT